MRLPALILAATTLAHGQWTIEDSHTTASLRGIHSVGGGVAWASGSQGTVLRTTDDGAHWQPCATPPGAEKLDFRGIQAFDAGTAIVMSSGKGDLSRLYKTTDACQTWKLVFTNPDKEGFWDAIKFSLDVGVRLNMPKYRIGTLLGDPVNGNFVEFSTYDYGENWSNGPNIIQASAMEGEGIFAASNSSLYLSDGGSIFVTGGKSGSRSRVLTEYVKSENARFYPHVSWKYLGGKIPLASGDSAGAFSVATSHIDGTVQPNALPEPARVFFADITATYVVVGGDYKKPDRSSGTAAFSVNAGQRWTPSKTPPHGYRSAVAYDPAHNLWITVGPNGTDISLDDGRNWQALKPAKEDPEGADRDWNALSLPFVVGPKGRIGKLNPAALPKP